MQHRNSKMITIFRAGSFLSRAQGKDVQDYFSTSKKSIGSYWESTSSRRIGTGLSIAEEIILLPLFLDCDAQDRDFRKKLADFYVDIDTKVPYNTGAQLEIGLTLDNDKDIYFSLDPLKSNMPIEPMDYIRYRHAIKHPFVAPSKEAADGNSMIEFYIFDKSETMKKNTKKADEKDAAIQIFLTVKADPEKVDSMLTLLGLDPREYSEISLKLEALRRIAEEDASKFTSTYEDTDLDTHAWIKTMVNTGVVKILIDKYYDKETNKLLANSLEEFTTYLQDDDNSDMVVALKARTQETKKRPVNATANTLAKQ